jgi:hypothetical protein
MQSNERPARAAGLACLGVLAVCMAPLSYADSSFYLTAGAGTTRYETRCEGGACDRSDTGFRLAAGWEFADRWSVEGLWLDAGKFIASDVTPSGAPFHGTAEVSGFGATVGYALPLGESFDIGARVGVASMKADFKPGPAPAIGGGKTTTQPLYNLSARWHFAPAWSLRADWDGTFARMNRFDGQVDVVTVGVQYNFGGRP